MAPSELFPQLATIAADGRKRRGVDFDPYAYPFNLDDLISPASAARIIGG